MKKKSATAVEAIRAEKMKPLTCLCYYMCLLMSLLDLRSTIEFHFENENYSIHPIFFYLHSQNLLLCSSIYEDYLCRRRVYRHTKKVLLWSKKKKKTFCRLLRIYTANENDCIENHQLNNIKENVDDESGFSSLYSILWMTSKMDMRLIFFLLDFSSTDTEFWFHEWIRLELPAGSNRNVH